ncbi:MAG: hypothetical protein ACO3MW_04300 [Rhodospirillales bacterium]|jgi:hypothetical protein
MPVSQNKPRVSSSYEFKTKTMAPINHGKSRLRVICSRHHEPSPVKNLDMLHDATREDTSRENGMIQSMAGPKIAFN